MTIDSYKQLTIEELKKYWYLDESRKKIKGIYSWLNWIWEVTSRVALGVLKIKWTTLLRIWYMMWKKKVIHQIVLERVPCHFWWVRWYFICPFTQKRCLTLYMQDNWAFAGRAHLKLLYPSQLESKNFREWRKLFANNSYRIEKLRDSIKFPYRNWQATRKQRKLLKQTKYALSGREEGDMINELAYS